MRRFTGQLFNYQLILLGCFCFCFFYISSRSVKSDSLWPHGLYSPWNSPGQNTGEGNLSLLQGIFPTQGLNPGLLHCRWILYQLSHKGSPILLFWVASQSFLSSWWCFGSSATLGTWQGWGMGSSLFPGSLGGFLCLHPFHLWAIALFTLEPHNFPSLPSLPTHDNYLI